MQTVNDSRRRGHGFRACVAWSPLPVAFFFTALAPAGAGEGLDREACAWDGFPLYGDVEVVERFPDVKVELVDSFPDLRVALVESFPDDCGQWRLVTSFPDVKVQYVESFPDVKVQLVDSFPGWP